MILRLRSLLWNSVHQTVLVLSQRLRRPPYVYYLQLISHTCHANRCFSHHINLFHKMGREPAPVKWSEWRPRVGAEANPVWRHGCEEGGSENRVEGVGSSDSCAFKVHSWLVLKGSVWGLDLRSASRPGPSLLAREPRHFSCAEECARCFHLNIFLSLG